MGVDLSCMVKNRFHAMDDHEACMRYINETLELINNHYSEKYIFDQLDYENFQCNHIIRDDIDGLFMNMDLHNGFWHVELGYHYAQYFFKHLYLRQQLYELARMLGASDFWICEEYYSWNSRVVNLNDEKVDFDEWKRKVSDALGKPIPTLDIEDVLNRDTYLYDSEVAYYDPCADYNEKLRVCEQEFGDYEIKNLLSSGPCVLLEKAHQLFLLNTATKKFVTDGKIDDLMDIYGGYRFTVFRDGKSALFDRFGNQLSDFDDGFFEWGLEQTPSWCFVFLNKQTGFCDREYCK